MTLYLNGIHLDPDNVIIGPRPSGVLEFKASIENRNLKNYSNVWISIAVTKGVTNYFSARSWELKNVKDEPKKHARVL